MQRSCAAEQGDCSTILSLALAVSVLGMFRHNTARKMLTAQRDISRGSSQRLEMCARKNARCTELSLRRVEAGEMSPDSKASSIPMLRRGSSIFGGAARSRSDAFWPRITYLTSHYEAYWRNLFHIIKEKFWLNYLIFAFSTLRHSTGAGLITGAHSQGSENGLG